MMMTYFLMFHHKTFAEKQWIEYVRHFNFNNEQKKYNILCIRSHKLSSTCSIRVHERYIFLFPIPYIQLHIWIFNSFTHLCNFNTILCKHCIVQRHQTGLTYGSCSTRFKQCICILKVIENENEVKNIIFNFNKMVLRSMAYKVYI